MGIFVCPKESYLPHHCEECHEVCKITIRTSNENHYCIECVKKMLEMLKQKE